MNSKTSRTNTASLAASVAPEDLKCGDFVGVLSQVVEFPSFFWCESFASERDEVVRVRYLPAQGGVPRKIKAVCLPFIYAQTPCGQGQILDVRQVQLVRLRRRYAKTVWKDSARQNRRPSRRKGT
jgi:hypothetical protein